MLLRILNWVGAHPDDEPGYVALVALLQALTARMTQVISEQRNGLMDVLASTLRKRELRRAMMAVAIPHLAEIGARAARERHELGTIFRFRPAAGTLLAFLSAVRGMYEEALAHKELLVKHGLSESVLAELGTMLDELDAAIKLGTDGRAAHTAATRELVGLTREARRIVRGMDARNRLRFRDDAAALGQWVSARTVRGVPRGSSADEAETPGPVQEGGTPAAGGDVRPAA